MINNGEYQTMGNNKQWGLVIHNDTNNGMIDTYEYQTMGNDRQWGHVIENERQWNGRQLGIQTMGNYKQWGMTNNGKQTYIKE